MDKKFTYIELCGEEQNVKFFNYKVSKEKLLDAVVDLVYDDYFWGESEVSLNEEFIKSVKQCLKDFINNNSFLGCLVNEYYEELKDYFEHEAFEHYKKEQL